jgi:hypothetical protein
MQAEERRRLVKQYNRYDGPELNPVARVAKCAAGLLVVAVIAAIGQSLGERDGEKLAQNARATAPRPQGGETSQVPQSKVYELEKASLRETAR